MSRKHLLVVGGAALLVALVAGAAIGATKVITPKQENQAVLADAANQLGVSTEKLNAVLKQALKNRVDAAVTDGRLTKEQAAELKKRIEANDVPLFWLGHGRFGDSRRFGDREGFEHDGRPDFRLQAAADYLGLTQAKLRQELENGKTVAQVAKARDKSVTGLVDAMVKQAETKLDEAVENGRLTQADKTEMLTGLRKRIADVVNGRFPSFDRRFRPGEFGFKGARDDRPGASF